MTRHPYMFLISPGSALGSAMMTLGKADGRAQRQALDNEISRWFGHFITLSGELDDEIQAFPMFACTLRNAETRAREAGLTVATRPLPAIDGTSQCAALAVELGIPKDAEIVCTGAWASHGDSGWVNAVCAALIKAGYTRARISENAIYEPEAEDANDAIVSAFCA